MCFMFHLALVHSRVITTKVLHLLDAKPGLGVFGRRYFIYSPCRKIWHSKVTAKVWRLTLLDNQRSDLKIVMTTMGVPIGNGFSSPKA